MEHLNPYQAPGFSSNVGNDPGIRPPRAGFAVEIAILTLLAIASLPLAAYSSMYFFAARVALEFGHWPTYGHPDPKDLPDDFAPSTAWLESVGMLALFIFQIATFRVILGRARGPNRQLVIAAALVPATAALTFAILVGDPVGVLDWLMD